MADNRRQQSQPTAIEYAGKVVAWESPECKQVVATGRSNEEAREAAKAAGYEQPFLERVPDRKRRFVGTVA